MEQPQGQPELELPRKHDNTVSLTPSSVKRYGPMTVTVEFLAKGRYHYEWRKKLLMVGGPK